MSNVFTQYLCWISLRQKWNIVKKIVDSSSQKQRTLEASKRTGQGQSPTTNTPAPDIERGIPKALAIGHFTTSSGGQVKQFPYLTEKVSLSIKFCLAFNQVCYRKPLLFHITELVRAFIY